MFFNNTTGVIDVGVAPVGSTTVDNATLEAQTTAGEVGLIRFSNFDSLTAGS